MQSNHSPGIKRFDFKIAHFYNIKTLQLFYNMVTLIFVQITWTSNRGTLLRTQRRNQVNIFLVILICVCYGKLIYLGLTTHEHRGGLKGYPPPTLKISKGYPSPLKILLAQPAKILRAIFAKILEKMAKIGYKMRNFRGK